MWKWPTIVSGNTFPPCWYSSAALLVLLCCPAGTGLPPGRYRFAALHAPTCCPAGTGLPGCRYWLGALGVPIRGLASAGSRRRGDTVAARLRRLVGRVGARCSHESPTQTTPAPAAFLLRGDPPPSAVHVRSKLLEAWQRNARRQPSHRRPTVARSASLRAPPSPTSIELRSDRGQRRADVAGEPARTGRILAKPVEPWPAARAATPEQTSRERSQPKSRLSAPSDVPM